MLASLVLFLLAPLLAFAYPNPGKVTGAYSGVHDPGIAKLPNGTYILIVTGVGLPIRTSTDRTNWVNAGSVFPNGAPAGTNTFTGTTNGALWAPDVTYVNGKLILYYAASSFGSQNSGIFMAQSTTGLSGSWTDNGLVIKTSSSDNWNAIDPHLAISGGNWYLSAGSFWTGIKLIPLSASTGKTSGGAITALAQRTANGGAIEASFLFQSGSFWYLFTSWDKCCAGLNSTYNIRVVRSSSITGPYVDQSGVAATAGGGTLIMASHGNIIGPGGQSILADSDAPALFYHWYDATTSYLGINLLNFTSGWPVVY